jgi:hypothetical protein
MPFQTGNNLSRGRPKGSKGKRTIEFQEVLERKNFNVAEALVWCYREAKNRYQEYNKRFEDGRLSAMEDNAPKYLKICADMAKELASYSFPKLKAIEHQKVNPLEGMTPEQKLEAMRQAVAKLELEIEMNK